MANRGRAIVAGVVLGCLVGWGAGCGPRIIFEQQTDATDDGAVPTTSTAADPDPGPGPDPSPSTAPPPDPDTGVLDTGADSSAGGFIIPLDGGGGPGCSIFEQDCPTGEKCMPWANDGGGTWNSTRCSPVVDNPDGVGDPCVAEGSGTRGSDSCDFGSMCWNLDPDTLEGTCVAFCIGSAESPTCADEFSSCSINSDGVLALCIPRCDPLLEDCAPGQACYPVLDGFQCVPDASGGMGAPGDECQFINECGSGSFCADVSDVPGCEGSLGCCSSLCSLDDPMPPCSPEQVCVPWFDEGEAPPGYEFVGSCRVE